MFDGGMFIFRGTDINATYFYEIGHVIFILLIIVSAFCIFPLSMSYEGVTPRINSRLGGFVVILCLFVISCVAAAFSNYFFGHPTFFRPTTPPPIKPTPPKRAVRILSDFSPFSSDCMPFDVLISICSFLSAKSLYSLSSTNKHLRSTLSSGQTCSIIHVSLIKSSFYNHKFIIKNIPTFQKSLLLMVLKINVKPADMMMNESFNCDFENNVDLSWCNFMTCATTNRYIPSPKYCYKLLYLHFPLNLIRTLRYKMFNIHPTTQDLYLLIHRKVYDATEFAYQHPGGLEVMSFVRGMDGTAEYERVIHSEPAKKIMSKLLVWSC